MTTKKILVDARVIKTHPNRGIAKYLQTVIKSAELLKYQEYLDCVVFDGVFKNVRYRGALGQIFYIFEEQFILPFYLYLRGFTHLISPNQTSPLLLFQTKQILIIHDIIYWENINKKKLGGPMFLSSLYRSVCMKVKSVCRSSKVVTVSKTSRSKILQVFKFAEQDISILPNTISRAYLDKASGVWETGDYLLCIGGLAKHKNLEIVENIFSGGSFDNLKLKVVCNHGGRKFNSSSIEYFENLTDSELSSLYEKCSGLIFPSLDEGFGIPLLEAMAWGKPVCCSNIPVFREIMEKKAYFFDPRSEEEIKAAIIEISSKKNTPINYKDILAKYDEEKAVQCFKSYLLKL